MSEQEIPAQADPIAQQLEAMRTSLSTLEFLINENKSKLSEMDERLLRVEEQNSLYVSDLRSINRRLSNFAEMAENNSRFTLSDEEDEDNDEDTRRSRNKKKRNSTRNRRSTVWDAIDGKFGAETEEEEEFPKPRPKASTHTSRAAGIISVEPTVEYPKDKIKTRSIGGLLKLAEMYAEMETIYKGRKYFPSKLVDPDLRREMCAELRVDIFNFNRLSAKEILQCMVTLVRPKTQIEYMQAYERYAKIDLPDPVSKLLATRQIVNFYNLIYGPILEVLNKFQRLYDIFMEDATDRMKATMPREEWGQTQEPQLYQALFKAFGVLHDKLLNRVKLREVKKCESLDELLALIRKVVSADKKASDTQASICVDYGQDVKSIQRVSNRILSSVNVMDYTGEDSDEDEHTYHSLPDTPNICVGKPAPVHPAPEEVEFPTQPYGDSSADEDSDDLQAFTPKPGSNAQAQHKGCLSFYRNNGKCANIEKRGKCDFSHDPADILKLHEDLEAQKRSAEFRNFLEGMRSKAKTPQRPTVTFGQKPTQKFSSDLVRSTPGANAAASPSFEKRLYQIDKFQADTDDDHE
jgi:hypothetical protein